MKIKWLDRVLSRFRNGHADEDREGHGAHLIGKNTSTRVLEAYSMARTNLLYTGDGEEGSMVLGFTSASPNDGKSLTCANLAISFAMSGKRVLLIDGDMRKPTQKVAFDVKSETGLSEYLAGVCEEPEICATTYENLSLLTAGRCPPNPAELFYRKRFAELIEKAKESYDCVFVDLPPIGLISDATIVAPHIQSYVMVVRANRSDARFVQVAIESIERVGGKIAGFVLNAVVDDEYLYYGRKKGRYGKYYGKYYGRYYYGYSRGGQVASSEKKTAGGAMEAEKPNKE